MKIGYCYEFVNGNKFMVQVIKDGLCHCKVIGRYEMFYMTIMDGKQKLFDGEILELEPQ